MVEVRKSKQEAVKVIVRCRPLSSQEIEQGYSKIIHMRTDRGQIELKNPKDKDELTKDFTFDAIYDETSTQSMLYEETFRDLVDSVLNGYNATIFAYGQTGTGKTHTMEGRCDVPDERGVIYKCIDHIFDHISSSRNQQYLVRASYLEIYQEELRDLLSKDSLKRLEIKEKPDGGVYVKDLSAFVTNSAEAIQKVMATGNAQRSVGRTNMNEHSSRSHAIFIITVECSQVGLDGENHITVGRLNLVDLAGSERQEKTGAVGERFKEATKINLSLSALGNVISALVDKKSSHVPYRDSKLTRLLQDSLGGNSKTVMVACIGPASYNYEETLGTLRYANRAKNIKNQPKINEDPKDALLREFQEEIERLRAKLQQRKSRPGKTPTQSFYEDEKEKLESDIEKIMNDDNLIRQEKEKIISELEEKSRLLEKERLEQAKVAEQIASIESRLISGEGSDHLETRTKQQQKELETKRKELAEQKRREREMAELLERQEEDTVDLKQTFSDLTTEVEAKTKKLKKLILKLRQARNEIRDTQAAFSDERQDLDQSIAEISKELKLKLLIAENFIPRDVCDRIKERAEWNEEDSCWNVNSYQHRPSSSPSTSNPIILGENEDGILIRSSGADSGVSVGSTPMTSQFLDKRLIATPGIRRPISMCERILVEKAREQLSSQRRPPISGTGGFVEAIIPEETIRFCGENIIVFSGLERFVPDVSDEESNSSAMISQRVSSENVTIDASKILAPIINSRNSKNGALSTPRCKLDDDSSESEGICADIGSITSSMCHSMIVTSSRSPSRIPMPLMSRSLSTQRAEKYPTGSGEQLCVPYGNSRQDAQQLLLRSQERRNRRAASFDPRCLLALSSSAMTSSISSSPSHSRLLPKRPQWIRHQPIVSNPENLIISNIKQLLAEKSKNMNVAKNPLKEISNQRLLKQYRWKSLYCFRCNHLRLLTRTLLNAKRILKLRRHRNTFFCHCFTKQPKPLTTSKNLDKKNKDALFIALIIAFIFRCLLFFSEHFSFVT